MELSNDEFIYHVIQGKYIKLMMQKEKYKDISEFQIFNFLFPSGWLNNSDLDKKIEYLIMAINQDKNLLDLEGISYFEEGVKRK